MRQVPLPYVLWVLLPVFAGGFTGKAIASREAESTTLTSTNRMGMLTVHLFSVEMGQQATQLIQEAPILSDPPSGSPLITAARTGDTVAALGFSSETLTLSVALAEGSGDSTSIRATTAPFLTRTPETITSRTGFGVALYLRGDRAATSPGGFGPETLDGANSSYSPQPVGSVLFPLTPSGANSSPAQLLVGPLRSGPSESSPWLTGLGVLVALGLGVLASFTPYRREAGSPGPTLRLLVLIGLPLVLLWTSLFEDGSRIVSESQEALREDMVRVLSLMKDGGLPISSEALLEATGFRLLRGRDGEIVESTLPPGPLAKSLLALPLPPPTFPSLGTLTDEERGEVLYANLRDGPDQVISLVAPVRANEKRNLKLLLAGLGGLASLLSLGFPLRARRSVP